MHHVFKEATPCETTCICHVLEERYPTGLALTPEAEAKTLIGQDHTITETVTFAKQLTPINMSMRQSHGAPTGDPNLAAQAAAQGAFLLHLLRHKYKLPFQVTSILTSSFSLEASALSQSFPISSSFTGVKVTDPEKTKRSLWGTVAPLEPPPPPNTTEPVCVHEITSQD